ncbi:MAG: hypothetical protein AAGI52_02700 [Bacteroidota bacterium]
MLRFLPLLFFVALASAAQAQPVSGNLYTDDERHGGRFYEVHTIDLEPGDVISVVLISQDFDPMVYIKSPMETWANNDDCTEGDITTSCLEHEAEYFGTYEVWAMTYQRGAYGDYTIEITKTDD